MKIGIIGVGFVGDAVKNGFESIGEEIIAYDPMKLPDNIFSDILGTDMVFICVPTPMDDTGDIDSSIVEDTINRLDNSLYCGIIVIKSTIRPDVVSEIIKSHPHQCVLTNPEYLTQRTARSDFINAKWVIIGGPLEGAAILANLYRKLCPDAKIKLTSPEVAMMAKYMSNSLFAVKISLMNEFYKLWQESNMVSSWDEVVDTFKYDDRVSPHHLQVPGPDCLFGWGGICFPKDLSAMMSLADSLNTPSNVMKAAIKTNDEVRNQT